jgi:hypothetical protein
LAQRRGTLYAIHAVGGVPLLETRQEIDVSELDVSGMVKRKPAES